jgi:hypothetical protein
MEVEDAMAWVDRERRKCEDRMREAAELNRLVEDQHKRLEKMVDEKQEAMQVMEVSIREQVKAAEKKMREADVREG